MTRLAQLVVTWRYWDVQTQAAPPENYAEFHDQFLAVDRELKDAADRLAKTATTRAERPSGAPGAERLSVSTLQPHETVDGTGGSG